MMNLFENLQMMKESKSSNEIIKVKITGLAPSSEGSSEEEKEYRDFVKNDYNLDIIESGDITPEEGYEIVQGDREDIETYLSEVLGFEWEDVEVIDALKESNEVYMKNNDKYYIIYDKKSNKELFRAAKNGGAHGATINDLIKSFGLKLIEESDEIGDYDDFDKKVDEIESKLNKLNNINDIYQIVLIDTFKGGSWYFRIGVKSNLLNGIKLNKESELNDVWIIKQSTYKDTIYYTDIIENKVDEKCINEILKAIKLRHKDIKNRGDLIEKLVKIGIDKNRMCLYNNDDDIIHDGQLTYSWLKIDDTTFWLEWSTIDELVDKIQHKIKL